MRSRLIAGVLLAFVFCAAVASSQMEASQAEGEAAKEELHVITFDQSSDLIIRQMDEEQVKHAKKVEEDKTIKQVLDILNRAEWIRAEVSMARRPDYQIFTVHSDPYVPRYAFDFWISPLGDRLEVVMERESLYGKIGITDSRELLALFETP